MSEQEQHLEVEAKLWVEDLPLITARLQDAGAVLHSPRVYEQNVRYDDARGTLTPNGIVVRLRKDDRVRLTYKGPGQHEFVGLQNRFEAEVTVDDFDTMDLILKQLGYKPFMTYEKYRTTYVWGAVEVMLDEMPYGTFVEVEGPPSEIERAITALGLTKYRRFNESYAVLFEYVRANLSLDFTDLTFANFAGVQVPSGAFQSPANQPSGE